MTWAHPIVFGAIPLALVSAWWIFHRASASSGVNALAHVHRMWVRRGALAAQAPVMRRRARAMFFILGIIGGVLSLARPQWGTIEETSFDQSREVLLALDLSRSMLAEDVSPSRLARAKLLIEALLEHLHGERVGLVVFAGTAFLQSPLSADDEVLRDFLAQLDPSYLPQGGTNYDALLATAQKAFSQAGDGDRFLVILSDGEAHDAVWKDDIAGLQQRGIRVIGLGVGTPAGAVVPDGNGGFVKDEQGAAVLSRLEPATLQALATATAGTYRDAATWVDIAELVNATVEQGRTGRYVEQRHVHLHDRFQWFLAPAVLALLLSYWIEFPVFPTARVLQARTRAAHTVRASAAAAVLLLLLWPVPRSASAAVTSQPETGGQPRLVPEAAPPPPPQQNQLEATVAELSAKAELMAPDYARLATDTIAYVSQATAASPVARLGMIEDALAGVDRGEAIDRQASDWPALRHELERLKEFAKQPPPLEQQNQPSQEKQDQGGGRESQERQSGGGGHQQEAAEDQAAGTQQGSQQQSNERGGSGSQRPTGAEHRSDAPSDGHEGNAPKQRAMTAGQDGAAHAPRQADSERGAPPAAQPEPAKDRAGAQTAEPRAANDRDVAPGSHNEVQRGNPEALEAPEATLGDLNDGSNKQSPPVARASQPTGQQPQIRMVGGGRAVSGSQTDGHHMLADALSTMERIKEGDAPAVLFERMNQADGPRPPAPTGKNW